MSDFTEWRTGIYTNAGPSWADSLCHHGKKGQEWGKRRWQYEDGSLTPAGREHYGVGQPRKSGGLKNLFKSKKKKTSEMTEDELRKAIERNKLEEEYRKSKPASGLLSKGINLAKDLYEQHSKNKSEEAERKIKERELKYKENELKIRNKEAGVNQTKAEAEKKKAEAERLKANAEDNKWDYYTHSLKGRRTLKKQIKGERAKNEAELVNAKASQQALKIIDRQSKRLLSDLFGVGSMFSKDEKNKADAVTAFLNANKQIWDLKIGQKK